MIRLKHIIALALAGAVGFTLCSCNSASGKKTPEETEEVVAEIDTGTRVLADLKSESEEETQEETEEETKAETPPQEGYVRSPLTNGWVPEEEAQKRPIAVMYPTDKKAQPQYGLDRVEIFYEIQEEGSMSRQMGIITNWEDLDRIGNIRSTRDYYVREAMEWDSILVHFGGPEVFVKDILTRADVDNINGVSGAMGPDYGAFYRIPKGSKSEHSAYTDGEHLTNAIEKAEFERNHRSSCWQEKRWKFASEETPVSLAEREDSVPAAEVDMSGSYPITKSKFVYNVDDGLYYRSIYGTAQKDAATGEQMAFTNILIAGCDWENRSGSEYLTVQVLDSGKEGYFITGGNMIHCTWEKTDDYAPTRFYDDQGTEIVLNTGKTMVCIARNGADSFLADGERFAF